MEYRGRIFRGCWCCRERRKVKKGRMGGGRVFGMLGMVNASIGYGI